MADRRMFTRKVTDDDRFTSLSSSAQALYFHLSMTADDDGFNNQVTTAMFKAHASVQDLEALLDRRYIYQFEDGVIVIKHWRMANALRKDRYTQTSFKEDLKKLKLDENGAYTFSDSESWLPSGCQLIATDKDSIEEDRIEENINNKKWKPPTVEEVRAYCQERQNGIDAEAFVAFYESKGWYIGKNKMKSWKSAVITWERSRQNDSRGSGQKQSIHTNAPESSGSGGKQWNLKHN